MAAKDTTSAQGAVDFPAPGFLRKCLSQPAFLAALLVVVALTAFWPVLRAEFVNYDDPDYVTSNAHVQAGLSWNNVVWASHYNEALRLNPDNPEAHYNLCLALLRLNRKEDAVHHCAEALRLRPDYPEAQRQMESFSRPE